MVSRTSGRAGRGGERGAAAVELAFVLVPLALLIFGILEFGRGYNARIQLTAAVREGARAAALGENDATVVEKTKQAATGLRPDDVSVTVVPAGGCSSLAADDDVAVDGTYPFTFDIPFFGTATITLSASGVMRCGA